MINIDKSLIKKQFNSGIKTYTKEAFVQKQIACKLINEFCLLNDNRQSRIFEVGAGTGFLTQNIIEKLRFDQLMVNDIAISSKQKIQELEMVYEKPIQFIEGDAEEIAFPQKLDAVISASTIQWFKNKPAFFKKLSQSLKPGGVLAFSTFGCHNFSEINAITGVGLDYLHLHELTDLLSDKFNIHSSKEWIEKKEFDAPINVLWHMKQTGVNAISKSFFGKQGLINFIEAYQQNFSNHSGKVTLTYNPIMIIAQKK